MKRTAALLSLIAWVWLLAACAEIELPPRAPVTPESPPPEIEGAAWLRLPVSYCIVRGEQQGFVDHDTFTRLTQRAFDAWGVPVRFDGDCPGGIEHGNGRNEIGWGSLTAPGDAIHQAGETHLRFRRALLGAGEPEIIEADITIEADPPGRFRSERCLYTTLLHETGHFLGLPHIEPPAVMAPALVNCPQELMEADVAAIQDLYPELESVVR